ncbi:MAG: RnfABCDGE type electron transport complex subunit B [Methanosarcinales archaeon Met12]|nr:MAG: RnfABCDGE type electron transport complex subunit B [Methanosarcinales archaeon Met12]
MMSGLIINAIIALSVLGIICSAVLVWAAKKFAVMTDPRVEKVLEVLPGINCGACGFPSCYDYAEQAVSGKAAVGLCTPGGEEVAEKMGNILGVSIGEMGRRVALLQCAGGIRSDDKFQYDGVKSCRAAALIKGGGKACAYNCLGYGDCANVCPVDAITIGEDGLPMIDEQVCVGCDLCVDVCPKDILTVISRDKQTHVLCSSRDKGEYVRSICEVGCIGCGICVKVCPFKAITIKDNLAVIDSELCTDCGICVEKCPQKCIKSRV